MQDDDGPTIKSLADVRPGDICFTNIGGLVPGVFPVKLGMLALGERVRIGRLSVDHVLIVTRAGQQLGPGAVLDGITYETGVQTCPYAVQAMPGGAERIKLTNDKHWNDRTAFVRLPEDYAGQRLDAARIAVEFVDAGVRYSFASYLALALWRHGRRTERLEAWIDRRQPARSVALPGRGYRVSVRPPVEAICSVLVDQAWSMVGHRVVQGVAKQAVTPGRLAMELWHRKGAIWGGPGIL
jgi:hypothetical protein